MKTVLALLSAFAVTCALAMPAAARVAIYLIACVQPVLAVLVCVAGILDLWVDFRRLKPPSQEAGNFSDFF